MSRPSMPSMEIASVTRLYHEFNRIHARLLGTLDPEIRRELRAELNRISEQLRAAREKEGPRP